VKSPGVGRIDPLKKACQIEPMKNATPAQDARKGRSLEETQGEDDRKIILPVFLREVSPRVLQFWGGKLHQRNEYKSDRN